MLDFSPSLLLIALVHLHRKKTQPLQRSIVVVTYALRLVPLTSLTYLRSTRFTGGGFFLPKKSPTLTGRHLRGFYCEGVKPV